MCATLKHPSAPRDWQCRPVCSLYVTVRWAEPLMLCITTAAWQPEGFHFSNNQFGDRTVCVICRSQKVILQDVGLRKRFPPAQLNKCFCQLYFEYSATLIKYQWCGLCPESVWLSSESCFESSASSCIEIWNWRLQLSREDRWGDQLLDVLPTW